jgi:hypothetical protein
VTQPLFRLPITTPNPLIRRIRWCLGLWQCYDNCWIKRAHVAHFDWLLLSSQVASEEIAQF